MSDHFRSSFSLANKTPHALSSSKSINIDTIVTILETILLFENLLFLYTENIKFELTPWVLSYIGGRNMEKKLNHLLADLVVEYHKLQSFHWYLKGYHFFDDHAKLEEYYDAIAEAVDTVAEDMLMLGFKPESTMKGFMALSTIEEAKNKEVTSEEAYEIILKDFKQLLDEVKAVKALAEKDDVYVTSNLMDDYIELFSKAEWMVGEETKKPHFPGQDA